VLLRLERLPRRILIEHQLDRWTEPRVGRERLEQLDGVGLRSARASARASVGGRGGVGVVAVGWEGCELGLGCWPSGLGLGCWVRGRLTLTAEGSSHCSRPPESNERTKGTSLAS
jgi:hypothetical protein